MAAINGHLESNGATVVDNGLYHASTSAAPLAASEAVAHLATYKNGDGLAMSELVDSKAHGGLTYNGAYDKQSAQLRSALST
jgi:shikimate kinase